MDTESYNMKLHGCPEMRELELSYNFIRNPNLSTQGGGMAYFQVLSDCNKVGGVRGKISWYIDLLNVLA